MAEINSVSTSERPGAVCHAISQCGPGRVPLSRLLQGLNVAQQNLLVSLGIHLLVDLANHAVRIDDEAGALPELHALPLGLSDAQGLHEVGVGVGEQVNIERELAAKALMGGRVVGANPQDPNACGVEVGLARSERLALDGASGCVVFGVEVHDQPLAGKVREARGFSVLVRKREVGEPVPCLHHAESEVLSWDEYRVSSPELRATPRRVWHRGRLEENSTPIAKRGPPILCVKLLARSSSGAGPPIWLRPCHRQRTAIRQRRRPPAPSESCGGDLQASCCGLRVRCKSAFEWSLPLPLCTFSPTPGLLRRSCRRALAGMRRAGSGPSPAAPFHAPTTVLGKRRR